MPQKPAVIHSHWYYYIPNLQASSEEFYSRVEAALEPVQVPNAKTSLIVLPEGGIFSPRRKYLRVRRKEYSFDICAAPFGTGFFISWWLGEMVGVFWAMLLAIPFVGLVVQWTFKRLTYYRMDTALMFQECVRGAVNGVIDAMTEGKGIRALTELEQQPIMGGAFARR